MWKTILALLVVAFIPVVMEAQTWIDWRSSTTTTYIKCKIRPGNECFWYFDGGATDSPLLEKHQSCSKSYWRVRPTGAGSPIAAILVCEDEVKANCEIEETINKRTGSYGDVILDYDAGDLGAKNNPNQLSLVDPTSGEGYVIVGCNQN